MIFILLLSILLCVISIKNLPLGYSLCLLSKLVIPIFVKFNIGGISVAFHSFCFLFILILFFHNLRFSVLWHNTIIRITLLWVIFTIIIGVISPDTPYVYNIKWILQTARDYIFVMLGWQIYKKKNQIETFFSLLFFITFISCIYGIFEYIVKWNPYMEYMVNSFDGVSAWETFYNDVRGVINGRIQGLTKHPLIHGQMMEVVLPFVLIFNKKNFITGGNLLVLLIIINVILAGSRASIISTFLFLVLILLNKHNYRKAILFILILLFTSIFIGERMSGDIGRTFKNMFLFWNDDTSQEIHGSSKQSRLLQYAYMIDHLGRKLLIGHGIGYVQFDNDINGEHPIMHGYESIVLKKITETGLLGFLIYIIWYLRIFFISTKYYMSNNGGRYYKEIKYLIITYFLSLLLTGDFNSGSLFFMLLLFFYKYTKMSESSSKVNKTLIYS